MSVFGADLGRHKDEESILIDANNGAGTANFIAMRKSYSIPRGYRFESPFAKIDFVSPMVTHIHRHPDRTHVVPSPMISHLRQRPVAAPILRRQRSRSLGDVSSMEWHEEELLRPQGTISTTQQAMQLPTNTLKQKEDPLWVSIMYGIMNATIVLPTIISWGNIIYRDDAFTPYMPVLIKMTIVSGMVHQLCFSTFSSLPFAVGQVQDAGLIFLSKMAASMAQYCLSRGYDDETMLATVTVGLGISTALLGCGLIIIGKLRLAQLVQALPTSVIGGYLAYIGYFCGESGLSLMAGTATLTFDTIKDKWIFLLPGVAGGITVYIISRILRHIAVLPISLGLVLVTFYSVLWVSGVTIEDATEQGWVSEGETPPVWYHTWDYLKLDKVVWSAFPSQVLTLVGMIFVVALSSSLDVAAIELEMKQPLDYNGELTMVGFSNVISGLTGGYTGSYIFSQSIFSLRAGIRSRTCGYVIAFIEFLVLVVPVPFLSFVPNFFFGSLLIMICVDLVYEWLWEVRLMLTSSEYGVCLATFLFIQMLGIEYGMIAGVLAYMALLKLGFDVGGENKECDNGRKEHYEVSEVPIATYGAM